MSFTQMYRQRARDRGVGSVSAFQHTDLLAKYASIDPQDAQWLTFPQSNGVDMLYEVLLASGWVHCLAACQVCRSFGHPGWFGTGLQGSPEWIKYYCESCCERGRQPCHTLADYWRSPHRYAGVVQVPPCTSQQSAHSRGGESLLGFVFFDTLYCPGICLDECDMNALRS